jgi:drug/metabolite transporter (DMT)-like permease
MATGSNRANWLIFVLLGLIWGSSYLWIKIGVEAVGPFTLVTLRCAFAAAFLLIVVRAAREPLPRSRAVVGHLALIGVLSIFLPFVLIAWGEDHVDSGLAAVLNATTPLFTVPIAAVFLRDEPIRLNRTLGVIVGFLGVLVVMAPTLAAGASADPLALAAQIAISLASLSYAFGAVYARRFVTGVRPMVISLGMVSFGLLYTLPLAIAVDMPRWSGVDLPALVAGAWLGILGSGVALLIFYRLLHDWGPTRTHVVVYLLPPVGVTLGVLLLNEPLEPALLAGTALIIGGAVLANARLRAGRRRSDAAAGLPASTTRSPAE